MTTRITRQGQGRGTRRKERGFAAALSVSLDISKGGAARHYPYWHLDLNAGCGYNDRADCEGSPLVFLRAAAAKGRRVNALFCDTNRPAVDELARRVAPLLPSLAPGSRAEARHADNADFLDEAADAIARREEPRYAVGTVLCDPNGFKDCPLEALVRFAGRFPRIDVVLNLNSHLFRMVGGCKGRGMGFDAWPTVPDILSRVGRGYWLVGQPQPGPERFVTFVGRTININAGRFFDFFPRESAGGRHVLSTMTRYDDGQKTFAFPKETP